MKRKLIILLVLLLAKISLNAQTTFKDGQTVSGTWTTYGSPYQINGKIEVPYGSTLDIQAGVVVKFSDNASLLIHGNLSAVGNSNNWIQFINSGSKWKGIAFDKSRGNNVLMFCKILYADYPNFNGISSYGALTVNESSVELKNCIIANNGGVGLHYINSPNQVVDHCTFAFNNNTDIYSPNPNESKPTIKNSIFWGSPRSIDNTCTSNVSYTCLFDTQYPNKANNLGGNILGKDPQFVNGKAGDFRLNSNSPCIRMGEKNSDMGAYGTSGGGNSNVTKGKFVPQPQRS